MKRMVGLTIAVLLVGCGAVLSGAVAAPLTDLKVFISSGAAGGEFKEITDANDDGAHDDGIIQLRNRNFPATNAQSKIVSLDIKFFEDADKFQGIVITTAEGVSFQALVANPAIASLRVTAALALGGKYDQGRSALSGSAAGTGNLTLLSWDAKADGEQIKQGNRNLIRFENKALPFDFGGADGVLTDPNRAGDGPNVALQGTLDIDFSNMDQTIKLPSSAFVGVRPAPEPGSIALFVIGSLGFLLWKARRELYMAS